MAVGGFGLGLVIASLFALLSRQKLLARAISAEAQLEAQKDALQQAGEILDQRFRVAAQDALMTSNEQFLQLARERLGAQQTSAHDLEKRQKAIAELINPVQEHLKALSGAIEQVKGTDLALREDLKNLGRETAKLVGALRDPSAQGLWGEFILEGVLDKSGLIKESITKRRSQSIPKRDASGPMPSFGCRTDSTSSWMPRRPSTNSSSASPKI